VKDLLSKNLLAIADLPITVWFVIHGILSVNPSIYHHNTRIAATEEGTSILEQAIKLYDQGLSNDPNNPNPIILINKGIAYSKLEKYEQSLQLFDKVLQEIEQNNIDAMYNKAKLLEQMDRTSEAEFKIKL